MDAVSVVGLLLAGVALVGLALVVGRQVSAGGDAPSPEVEPAVVAVDPVPGVWEQPSFAEEPRAVPSLPSPMSEPELRRESMIPLTPPTIVAVMHREVPFAPLIEQGWPPGRIPPSPPKYDHFRK